MFWNLSLKVCEEKEICNLTYLNAGMYQTPSRIQDVHTYATFPPMDSINQSTVIITTITTTIIKTLITGGQLGLVHRDDPGPALPHRCLRHSLPHQEEQVSDQSEDSIHVT